MSNAEPNRASARVKERQGARLVGFEPFRSVSGDGRRMVWLIEKEAWLARSTEASARPNIAADEAKRGE